MIEKGFTAFWIFSFLTFCLFSLPAAYSEEAERRARARDLGIILGTYPTGKYNSITDVARVKVGHVTLNYGDSVRTGVTAIVPRDDVWTQKVFAAADAFNGNGEMTGTHWINEAGWLEVPILLTDTLSVGKVSDGVVSYMVKHYPKMGRGDDVVLPVVAEIDDSGLNDSQRRYVSESDVIKAIEEAKSGPVEEGAVGAGTGAICYRFKGGIGTASRVIPAEYGGYTVGVLVLANFGSREELRIDGVPVGREIEDLNPEWHSEGSIIIVIATDAPLDHRGLMRLVKRSALGLARTGSTSTNGSGDLMIAFSTANVIPHFPKENTFQVVLMSNTKLNPIFKATVEATEEAIINALTSATTTVGRGGNKVYALPLDRLMKIMKKYAK